MRSAIFIILALALAGCMPGMPGFSHLAVGPAAPHPNVAVTNGKAPSALVIAPAVADDFTIPATGSVNEVAVRGWRHTLEAGYATAFPPAATGRTLEITSAELSFSPAAAGPGGTAAVVAAIRFKARLLDGSGADLGVLAGTVYAREANLRPNEVGMTDNAAKAVEALYETLTAELLAKF